MLQFINTLRNGPGCRLVCRSSSSWNTTNHQMISACSTSATATSPDVDKISDEKLFQNRKQKAKPKLSLVNMAFEALKNDNFDDNGDKTKNNIKLIQLLNVADKKYLSHELVASTITSLYQLVENKKINPADFEEDPRYKKLCKIFINNGKMPDSSNLNENSNFLYTIDFMNDSMKTITVDQAIKLMKSLAIKQTRVKPLLQKLILTINNSDKSLDIKESADILYNMSRLNFPDDSLIQKIRHNIMKNLDAVKSSPVVGSIITSLGMMRYRDDKLMDKLSDWVVKNKLIVRTQDCYALLLTLAILGYHPKNSAQLFQEFDNLKETDMIKPEEWLNVVWSLTILNKCSASHLKSALSDKFIGTLKDDQGEISHTKSHKLLNINAAAKYLMKNYSGPFLPDKSPLFQSQIIKPKDKQAFVKSITDSLANFFPSRDYFRTNVDLGTGFLLDVDFFINKKQSPLPVASVTSDMKDIFRIAIIANYYHDYCLGQVSLIGPVLLHQRLTEAQGYRVLEISHLNFHTDETLLKRITYLNERIKSIVK